MMNPTRPKDATQIEVAESQGIHAEQRGSKALNDAARAALAEAEARRAQFKDDATPQERNGRGGLDPVRYGDWEVKGLASDF